MEKLEEFLNNTYINADWEPLITYIKNNFIEKEKIRELLKEDRQVWLLGYQEPYLGMRNDLWKLL